MERQLPLIDSRGVAPRSSTPRRRRPRDDWRLDERTRQAGRKGLAEARRALEEAAQRAAA